MIASPGRKSAMACGRSVKTGFPIVSAVLSVAFGFKGLGMAGGRYLIGVDTGGTYTDAAVIEAAGHKVIASAKALTTKGDLSVGVTEAIRAALAKLPQDIAPEEISLVSVSTTLATNAVVEGHGDPVCVILAGFDAKMVERAGIAAAFPGMPVEIIGGGHDHNGDQKTPLDMAALDEVIARHQGKVDAFAIASTFAVRNPAHERRARERIVELTGKPVTVSSELSSALDAPRRALTSTLNARLISRITWLITAVRKAMATFGIDCPLMIVKGDGTLALAETVATRPIETVLSGPAASLVGAAWLSGLRDFLLSDMGGTTTDLGILQNGRPKVNDEGAEVGGWRTMVKAIDVRTIGLGGDSEVSIGMNGALTVGPSRIVPVSLIGQCFPEVLDMLDSMLSDPDISSLAARFVMRPLGWKEGMADVAELTPREAQFMAMVGERPRSLLQVASSAGAQRVLNGLRKRGLVQVAGFSPSDAAHVLGLQNNWSAEAAHKAAALNVRFREMRMPTEDRIQAFAHEVWSEVVRLTGRVILDTALGNVTGGQAILDAVCRGEDGIGLARISVAPKVPVVAVGGPVTVYYDEVGKRLKAQIVYPPFCDVANAVGAATGVIARSVTISVSGDGGAFRVHAPEGTLLATSGSAALAKAEEVARRLARAEVLGMGSDEPEIRVDIAKDMLPDAMNDDGLFAARITAEAIGRPQMGG